MGKRAAATDSVLSEGTGEGGVVYQLIKFAAGDYGVSRAGRALVRCQYEVDARAAFEVLVRGRKGAETKVAGGKPSRKRTAGRKRSG
jgi:hypothetical protein